MTPQMPQAPCTVQIPGVQISNNTFYQRIVGSVAQCKRCEVAGVPPGNYVLATALALVSVYFLYRLWRHSADDIKRARADVARLDGGLRTAAYAAQQLCAHFSLSR